jgi:hypothetical protein
MLTVSEFLRRRVDLRTHESQVLARTKGPRRRPIWPLDFELRIEWEGGSCSVPLSELLPTPTKRRRREGTAKHCPHFLKGSVFDELVAVATELEGRYGWSSGQCQLFVVSGCAEFPAINAWSTWKSSDEITTCEITMKVRPWVPAETVLDIYRYHQRVVLGGDNRPDNLRLLRLLVHATALQQAGQKWKDVMRDWNGRYPEWAYYDMRLMSRDFQRARARVLFPSPRYQGEGKWAARRASATASSP